MIVQKKGEGTTTYSNALEAAGFKMFLFKFNAHFNKGGAHVAIKTLSGTINCCCKKGQLNFVEIT